NLRIEFEYQEILTPTKIELIDLSGRIVMTTNVIASYMDLGHLQAGLYHFVFYTQDEKRFVQKISILP
ncbi:MAG: T9SS type A sorting domain-containing protein, partial [Bacteroidota bacterium]